MRGSTKRSLILVWVVTLISLCGFGAYLIGQLLKESSVGTGPSTDLTEQVSAPTNPTNEFKLYFCAPGTQDLAVETRQLRVEKMDPQQLMKRVITELVRGPVSVLIPTLPDQTTVNSMFLLEGGELVIDFGKEIRDHHPGGSFGEMITVYSVVNTLTENFDEVESVRFLVEGSDVETLVGHMDLTEPVLPDLGRVVASGDWNR